MPVVFVHISVARGLVLDPHEAQTHGSVQHLCCHVRGSCRGSATLHGKLYSNIVNAALLMAPGIVTLAAEEVQSTLCVCRQKCIDVVWPSIVADVHLCL